MKKQGIVFILAKTPHADLHILTPKDIEKIPGLIKEGYFCHVNWYSDWSGYDVASIVAEFPVVSFEKLTGVQNDHCDGESSDRKIEYLDILRTSDKFINIRGTHIYVNIEFIKKHAPFWDVDKFTEEQTRIVIRFAVLYHMYNNSVLRRSRNRLKSRIERMTSQMKEVYGDYSINIFAPELFI